MKKSKVLKSISLLLMTLFILSAVPAALFDCAFSIRSSAAVSGKCGENITWTLDGEGTLTISGTGEMYDYDLYYSTAPWYSNKGSVKCVIIENGVTSIGFCSFAYCGLTSVIIPDSVTQIGYCAFSYCVSLLCVDIGGSVKLIDVSAFENCTSLTSVTIRNSVTSICDWAFCECTSLTSVDIGDSVTSIGRGSFEFCTSLASIDIGDGVTSIGGYAFYECTSLTSVNMGDSVTSIGDRAFYDCSSLASAAIGDNVTSIGDYAFGYNMNETTKNPEKFVDFMIYCYEGTAAEKYAKDNGFDYELIPSVKKGNVNGDDKIDSTDVILIKRHMLNIGQLAGNFFRAGDIDGNGKLDSTDYIIIKKIILGLIKQ